MTETETDWDEFFGTSTKPRSSNITDRAKFPNASDYQIAIFEAFESRIRQIENGEKPRSMIIQATAGSGKSSTILACSNMTSSLIRKPIFLAFNNHIASELKFKLEGTNILAATTHSYWRSQWSNYIWKSRRERLETDQYKINNFIRHYLGLDQKNKKHLKSRYNLAKGATVLAQYGKQYGLVPDNYKEAVGLIEDDIDFWYHLIDFYDLDIDDERNAIDLAKIALEDSLDNDGVVDFHDMLYFNAVKRINGNLIESENHDVVIIDEVQDFNLMQRKLCHQMLSDKGFILSVGDKNQSISAFRGADIESMECFESEFEAESFPLSICYRCGTEIVDLARKVFPVIEAAPNAIKGKVEYLNKISINDFKLGDLIICRNNAPVISLAYKFMRAKIPAKMIGREIGEGLITIIKKIKCSNMCEFREKLLLWKTRQLELIDSKNPDDLQSKERILDKYESIRVFLENPNITTPEDLARDIDNLFTTTVDEQRSLVNSKRINLSTIHRVKGGEADRVYILDKFLFNPHYVRQEWQKKQEDNIRFVAYTRAREFVGFINSKDITDTSKKIEKDDISLMMEKSKKASSRLPRHTPSNVDNEDIPF